MSATDIAVLHIVMPDTPPAAWNTIRTLRGGTDGKFAHSVMQLSCSPAVLAGYMARRAIEKESARGGGAIVLHTWSTIAAQRCLPLATTHRPLVLNAEYAPDPRRLAAWARRGTVAVVCQSEALRGALINAGAPEPRCAVIRPGVTADLPSAPDRRALVRRRLRLDEHDLVLAALPPAGRGSGLFVATWAALLLEKVRPDVRLIIPRHGFEAERAWCLAVSCPHEGVVRVASPDLSAQDYLAACDLAVYLPSSHAPLDNLAAALAAGCPTVASATPAIREILADGQCAWLCRPDDPQDAARCMLKAIENPEQSRRQAERARERARIMFSLPQMLVDYHRVYENLAARRPAVCSNQ